MSSYGERIGGPERPSIFISYSHNETDAAFARQLKDVIEATSYAAWLDESNIPAGAPWDEYIDRKTPLVLLLLESTEIPHNFIRINYLDFTSPDKDSAFRRFQQKLTRVVGRAAPPPAPAPGTN